MTFTIQGGKPLHGHIRLSGAKNAATKMMIASLLTEEPCVLTNVPMIGEVAITEELCRSFGSRVQRKEHLLELQTETISNTRVATLSRRNRIPILAVGPLLSRVHEVEIPLLG